MLAELGRQNIACILDVVWECSEMSRSGPASSSTAFRGQGSKFWCHREVLALEPLSLGKHIHWVGIFLGRDVLLPSPTAPQSLDIIVPDIRDNLTEDRCGIA